MTCLACGENNWHLKYSSVQDYEHGHSRTARFLECRTCTLLVQEPMPTGAELLTYYPADYRPHTDSAGIKNGIVFYLKRLQADFIFRKIRKILSGSRDQKILELGSGAGHFLNAFKRRGYRHLLGVDLSGQLKPRYDALGIPFQEVNLETDFPDGQFDVVFLNYSLEHFLNPVKVLKNCQAHLRPGGRIVAVTPNSRSWAHLFFGRFWSGHHAPRHSVIFGPQSIQEVARQLEFKRVELLGTIDVPSWAVSFQNVWTSMMPWGAPQSGTSLFTMATLPLWILPAVFETAFSCGGSIVCIFYGEK